MEVQVVVNVQFERAWTPSQQVRKCKKRKNPCKIRDEKNEKHTREHINIKKQKHTPTHTNKHKHTQTHANTPKRTQRPHTPLVLDTEKTQKPIFLATLTRNTLLPRHSGAPSPPAPSFGSQSSKKRDFES